jgi:Fe-S-cluster containining protein
MVRAEGEMLREGLEQLPPPVRAEVHAGIAALAREEQAGTLPRHVVCPMLDRAAGACRVYEHRPGACRTYGFYVERGIGLHCERITEAVASRPPDEEPIVWGNAESVDAALARDADGEGPAYALAPRPAGAALPLTAWALSSSGSSPGESPEDAEPLPEPSRPSSVM